MNTPGARVLVVEDERMVAEVVTMYLRRDGHDVRIAHDGAQALEDLQQWSPDLVVLDLMLPIVDGFEVCRHIRETRQTPVIMLTARGDEVDRLLGLGLGADDYVTKPFSAREVAARVAAVLRRSALRPIGESETIRIDDLRINPVTRMVEDRRGTLDLTAREFDLLYHLARHPGQVFSREQLMTSVWDVESVSEAATVTVHMRRLRAKVELDPSRPRHLKTVWGVGYKCEP
jgi:DNA-binding response OmpR family regulator